MICPYCQIAFTPVGKQTVCKFKACIQSRARDRWHAHQRRQTYTPVELYTTDADPGDER